VDAAERAELLLEEACGQGLLLPSPALLQAVQQQGSRAGGGQLGLLHRVQRLSEALSGRRTGASAAPAPAPAAEGSP
jgi:hypothetical protein